MSGIDAYTKLLLHANKLNNGTSHIFSAVGNAKLDTSDKKFGASSLKCDGSGDAITTPDSEDFYFGSSDFTIDFWYKPASISATYVLFSQHVGAVGSDYDIRCVSYGWNPGDIGLVVEENLPPYTNLVTFSTAGSVITAGAWNHVEFVRNGNTWYIFVNGVSQSLTLRGGSYSNAIPNFTNVLSVGGYPTGGGSLDGWMDEFRISKNIARHTTNFTPSTSQYTSDIYTGLLLHFDGANASTSFVDSSGGDESSLFTGNIDKEITFVGDAKISSLAAAFGQVAKPITFLGNAQLDTAQSKFGGSSLLLDGTGDYLTTPNTNNDFNFGTNDFTQEFFIRFNSITTVGDDNIVILDEYQDNTNRNLISFNAPSIGGNINKFVYSGVNTGINITASISVTTGVWYHFAVVRNSGVITLYQDGIALTLTDNTSPANNIPNLSSTLYIGTGFYSGSPYPQYLNGWLDEVRISKGIARYTSNFTPTTNQYLTDSFTKLLLHFKGVDAATTTEDSSATGSALSFDGTGDYLTIPDSDDWDFIGDFTVDCWVKLNSLSGNYYIIGNVDYFDAGSLGWGIVYQTAVYNIRFSMNYNGATWAVDINAVGAITDLNWHHVAVVRNGSAINLYVDGVSVASASYSGTPTSSNAIHVGKQPVNTPNYFSGSIDEVRISKGIARYTSNFTPSTSEYDATSSRLRKNQTIIIA